MMSRRRWFENHGGVIFNTLVFIVALASLLALGWMMLLPMVLTARLSQQTGFDVTVQSLMVNPFSGRVELKELAVNNPEAFKPAKFMVVRAFTAQTQVSTILADKPVFEEILLDISEVAIVRRADGKVNTDAFAKTVAEIAPKPDKKPGFLIKRFTLRIGRLSLVDYPPGNTAAVVREIPLGVSKTFTQVTDLSTILTPTELEALAPVAMLLKGVIPGDLGSGLGSAVRVGGEKLREGGKKAEDSFKGLMQTLEEKRKS